MIEERTRRLRLVAATLESVRAEIEERPRLAALLQAVVPPEWPPEVLRDALPVFLEWHREHPEWTGWLGWYAVRTDRGEPVLCGSVGFKGAPDATGTAEIGYSVLPEHQGAGIAREMVAGLLAWAFRQAGVRCVEAETMTENLASIHVLEHNGFRRTGHGREAGTVRYRRPEESDAGTVSPGRLNGKGLEHMRYHHLGIPTRTPRPGEEYLKDYKAFCTDHESNPFGIQWMRYEADCPIPELVKSVPHVAFEVDDLAAALEGQEILIAPNSPAEGVMVAFIVCQGAPVEFLQFSKK